MTFSQFFKPTRWKIILAVLFLFLVYFLEGLLIPACGLEYFWAISRPRIFPFDDPRPCGFLTDILKGILMLYDHFPIISYISLITIVFLSYLLSCTTVALYRKLRKPKK
jgi:hypothetical protein